MAQAQSTEETAVKTADLLVLVPWLLFGAGLAVVCYRLLSRRRAGHRQRRDSP
jgi:hypothetical protein